MKIKLDEHDISCLRGIRQYPGANNHGQQHRLLTFGLIELCEADHVPATRKDVKESARQLKGLMARVEWPTDPKRYGDEKLRQKWYKIRDLSARISANIGYCSAKGYRLTSAGSELLKSIDAAARAVKWTVDAKDVTLEIEV